MGAAASALTVSAVPGIQWSIITLDADLRIRLMRFAPATMATVDEPKWLIHEAKNALRSYRTTEWLNSDTLEPVFPSVSLVQTVACSSEERRMMRCIQRAYPAGLHSLRPIDEHTHEYALVGMPWSSSGELRVDADRLMLEMTRVLARNGWRLHSRFGRMLIYSFTEAEIISNRRPTLSVSLLSHNLITFTGLPRAHQKEIDTSLGCTDEDRSWIGETYRIVLPGRPWHEGPSIYHRSIVIDLLCRLFSTLIKLHWLPSPIALSPNGLLFSSPVDQNRPKRRIMCAAAVWITDDNEISLTNFPSTVNDLLVSTARRHFGIIRSDRPSVTHYRIRATILSSTVRMHALLTVFLNELSLIGWRPMTSLQLFDHSDSDQVNVIFVLPEESLVRERSDKEKTEQCKISTDLNESRIPYSRSEVYHRGGVCIDVIEMADYIEATSR
ncbi:hypothetical protein PRIPAC_94020, partial [Pristionchus pacificus]|uniref:Uncharacterized protein n=1 Tax=Pristionchus pacificus TaxID=54126 RepID=A0A2A6BPY3_PRIPA